MNVQIENLELVPRFGDVTKDSSEEAALKGIERGKSVGELEVSLLGLPHSYILVRRTLSLIIEVS